MPIDRIVDARVLNGGDESTLAAEIRAKVDNYKLECDVWRLHFSKWKEVDARYIMNGLKPCKISFLMGEEGNQQEQLAGWLIDSLSPSGAYLNPDKHEPSGTKEFTDLLLTEQNETVIILSKTLSIFSRPKLPTRAKLSSDIAKKLQDDAGKIKNQCQRFHAGEPIYEQGTDEQIGCPRNRPVHAICLIPDLNLLGVGNKYGRDFLTDFSKISGDFFHVLDTVQLFRVMQAAHLLSETRAMTPMEAFSSYLAMRHAFVIEHDITNFDMTLDARRSPATVTYSFSK